MEVSIKKWGNSLGIRIPQRILSKLKIKESQRLDVQVQDGSIVIKPISSELNELLSKINLNNLHNEKDFGDAMGNEIW
ncbi:AbrB/MazE/SpoVT family DNA-binding domain-containing protein [Francisella sp. SYW-9]|uniref:AbrB/MazE/SpoVT family DNA-binding domain-containing protein n=1 Tax=Francisella sp. SYW-9 TaxID=2610888 RepID=UPI00123E1BBD|nr:AbrB/MazE/SpoVT family DNA-binding domain-containing protein [Francisella sp. SYW-9]